MNRLDRVSRIEYALISVVVLLIGLALLLLLEPFLSNLTLFTMSRPMGFL